jgi:hypothetical protein
MTPVCSCLRFLILIGFETSSEALLQYKGAEDDKQDDVKRLRRKLLLLLPELSFPSPANVSADVVTIFR